MMAGIQDLGATNDHSYGKEPGDNNKIFEKRRVE